MEGVRERISRGWGKVREGHREKGKTSIPLHTNETAQPIDDLLIIDTSEENITGILTPEKRFPTTSADITHSQTPAITRLDGAAAKATFTPHAPHSRPDAGCPPSRTGRIHTTMPRYTTTHSHAQTLVPGGEPWRSVLAAIRGGTSESVGVAPRTGPRRPAGRTTGGRAAATLFRRRQTGDLKHAGQTGTAAAGPR